MSRWNVDLSANAESAPQPADSAYGSNPAEHRPRNHGSEDILVETAKAGDRNAFGVLYERNAARIYRTAVRIMNNREDAEDVVQEAFLSAFVHLTHFNGRARFSTWLTRITVNAALMKLRNRRSRPELAIGEKIDDEVFLDLECAESSPGPEERYAQHEREEALRRAILELQPTHRDVIQIQRLEERSLAEAAFRLGTSIPATKTRLLRAKRALRRSPQLMILRRYGQTRVGL